MAGEYEVNFRERPEAYRYQSGEQGVFKVQPYKDELLPDWQFKDEAAAEASVKSLRDAYRSYRSQDDFVGMDMVRKYLQMGFTRAMRYAKYPGGQKYDGDGTEREPEQWAVVGVFLPTWVLCVPHSPGEAHLQVLAHHVHPHEVFPRPVRFVPIAERLDGCLRSGLVLEAPVGEKFVLVRLHLEDALLAGLVPVGLRPFSEVHLVLTCHFINL